MDLFEEKVRLHESTTEVGGLIITKSKENFKQPQKSLFGLDKLAAKKRQESEDLNLQFNKRDVTNKERFYRERRVETPSNRGGVSKEYFDSQARRRERDQKERFKTGLVSTSRKISENYSDSRKSSDYSRIELVREKESLSTRHRREAEWEDETPNHSSRENRSTTGTSINRFETPEIYNVGGRSPGHSSWDDSGLGSSRSTTPRTTGSLARNSNNDRYTYTPMPTPSFKHNSWMQSNKNNTGSSDSRKQHSGRHTHGQSYAQVSSENEGDSMKPDSTEIEEDGDDIKAENERLDRNWYQMDDGYDNDNHPFSDIPEEYAAKKERQLAERKKRHKQRLTAKAVQVHKDNQAWEHNRMLRSGVVQRVDFEQDEDFDEEGEARVHLLVRNILPPFLDGRIVFTRQPEPIIPVKDPESIMAKVAQKGSAIVKYFREQKERKEHKRKNGNWLVRV
ncbi:unnamed protein product [Schistosoma mattheei]|uniref:Uncharacterized protein n=1 Tax=Schistosoma mattheei TaxID=31246 RepID=A0AA85BUP9_9TREM|nr:unnamed protein product [Schistosoma mattheei]